MKNEEMIGEKADGFRRCPHPPPPHTHTRTHKPPKAERRAESNACMQTQSSRLRSFPRRREIPDIDLASYRGVGRRGIKKKGQKIGKYPKSPAFLLAYIFIKKGNVYKHKPCIDGWHRCSTANHTSPKLPEERRRPERSRLKRTYQISQRCRRNLFSERREGQRRREG